jgi:LysR family transcriptional regulator, transcriptional activator of the cysJI operon
MASIASRDLFTGLGLLRLRVFVAVVDQGGHTAAAAHLDMAQPTVSFHVKALEDLLGARLLVYRQRRVRLTPEGEHVYRVASAMLRDAERMAAAIQQIGEGAAGQLSVGASMAFEQESFFARVVAPFRAARPRLHLSFEFGHSIRLAEAAQVGEIDVAYVLNWRLPRGARYEPLHTTEFVLMVGAAHPLARKDHVTPDDVYQAGIIAAPLGSQEWPHYAELLHASGLADYRVGLEVDGVQARLLATQACLGVMGVFVPPYADDSATAGLRPVRLDVPPPRAEFGVVLGDAQARSPAAEAFVSWLREVARGSRPG